MTYKIGIDVGGTFTDFLVTSENGAPFVHKVLSSADDPSIAFIQGLEEIAAVLAPGGSAGDFIRQIGTIVHGTTVTTNATLTNTGAKAGLLTTKGLRDALEMRRGIREEQYNNRFTNVPPLVPRHLRVGIGGRLDSQGREIEPLDLEQVGRAAANFREQGLEAVAICFMNAYVDPRHERAAAARVREAWPQAYLTVSTDLLPSVRFYDRVSTTVLNAYVGPKLSGYIDRLTERLAEIGFAGVLLIMQSNGGVMSPQVAREKAAQTLLSGPAAGPGAGLSYATVHGREDCITIDMGGTSFDAALVINTPVMVNEGEINRYRIALPMLGIHTIGAGGGSIGWLDEGGLLRMGPQSAGAAPGPACYGRGGELPTCTDANLVLGYLNPAFFAGGKIPLDPAKARQAIESQIAEPMGLTVEDAAAGMYRVIAHDMAQGVREITIKRGFDPREFAMVVAGGAGPLHACMIGQELEIPLLIVPRESSIFCAAGMLISDLKHDFVRTFVARLEEVDWERLNSLVSEMIAQGDALLDEEQITPERRRYHIHWDCRYLKQYHEVSFEVPLEAVRGHDAAAIARLLHAEHNRMYGHSLEEQGTPIELINVRVQALGITEKPEFPEETLAGTDSAEALKAEREAYIPEERAFRSIRVYDGHKTRYGHRFTGPALIEQNNT
ncbi:MAG: hydantoinase/oxoprolinase family protein, partial [bacterium]